MVHSGEKSLIKEGGGWMERVSACEDVGQVEPAVTPGGVRKCKNCGK